jgi:hydroxymethylpyrimidine/phosphomethylpyrimidine kinase
MHGHHNIKIYDTVKDDLVPKDLLIIPNLQKALKLLEDSITFQQNQNLPVDYERGFLMRRDIFKAVET